MRRRALCVAAALGPALGSEVVKAATAAATVAAPAVKVAALALADTPLDLGPEVGPLYFGNHFHRLVPEVGTFGASATATLWVPGTIGVLRLWDSGTRWADLAPSPGVWNFERMDAFVDQARSRGARVLYTLGSTPRWASARPNEPGPYGPGCNAEPVRMAHWEEYVQRVAERYLGRIQAYELWNEPTFSDYAQDRASPGFFSGSAAQMVEMARIARRVLDRVDPKALLTTPGFVGGAYRLDLFFRSGGAALVQAVAFHFYSADSVTFRKDVADVRAVMQRAKLTSLPLWNTECGIETFEPAEPLPEGVTVRLTQTGAAARLAQFLLLGTALRIDTFFYYAWDNYRSGVIDRQGRRLPRFDALRRVQTWLLRARVAGVEAAGTRGVVIQAVRGTERFMFAWDDDARTVRLPVPAGWRIDAVQTLLDGPTVALPVDGRTLTLSAAPLRLTLVRV